MRTDCRKQFVEAIPTLLSTSFYKGPSQFKMKFLLATLLLSTSTAFLAPTATTPRLSPLHASGGPLSVRPIGIGSSSPSTTITNFDLESVHDTTDEWIRTRTGIESRNVLVHEGTRKVVGDAADGEKEEKETLRTLGVDGMKSL
jgi:hypothetical protein